MNRKNRFDLKNKRTLMAESLMKKFIFVVVMLLLSMAATVQAEPLYDQPFLSGNGSGDIQTINLSDTESIDVIDRSDSSDDWVADRAGYVGDDYKAGSLSNAFSSEVYYLGTFQSPDFGNQSANLEKLIQYYLGDAYHIEAYGKYEYDEEMGSGDYVGDLSFELFDLNTEEAEVKGGKWKITDDQGYAADEKINFYSVKGAGEFALYYVDPKQSAGTWTTQHLENNGSNIPAMSHFSVMRTFESPPPGSTDPAPEPATMLLFGFSLMGLAGMARRRNCKF